MASVSVTINQKRYEVACDEGQEAQITRLGRFVDDRVRQLAAAVGQLGDTKLMVMTSLLLADELSDKNDELERYKVENNQAVRERREEAIAMKLDKMAERILKIAEQLQEEEEKIVEVEDAIEDDLSEEES